MTISYNWLNDYLPEKATPEKLAGILTSIGLEVESLQAYSEIKGNLEGLIVGEVMTCEKHPGADKLKITSVSTGNDQLLQIVCGAANVAVGQKVVVAPVGSTIYPINGEPVQLKKARIRGVESEGMICAEDEIGLSNNHDGILILPPDSLPGSFLSELFAAYHDHIYEIGLTPNRMDAMSHLGVAKDICAWMSFHQGKKVVVQSPFTNALPTTDKPSQVQVSILNKEACRRYSGVSITGIEVSESPVWLKQKLTSIGIRPINNIVDITNFILHETGQPIHAFDADKIKGNKIIVKNLPAGTVFKTLDEKERKLFANDLAICNAEEPMALAGVYGGFESGVTAETRNIFLESAWFDPAAIRKTSLQHNLRTDAATRFEKGVDISNTVQVLKRAALLITSIAQGTVSGNIIDEYPAPARKIAVELKYSYLEKLSGKVYDPEDVKKILSGLGFDILRDEKSLLSVEVPFSKPDISLPADIVEEIMRIDGLDNIDIPTSIRISPSVEKDYSRFELKEKLANYLTGLGFYEMFTNSITNSGFYSDEVLNHSVKMINSLSTELDILRPQMLQGGLQTIAHNNNRRNFDLKFFEFGKTYASFSKNNYAENNHLALYVSGNITEQTWKVKSNKTDFYYLKGAVSKLLQLSGIQNIHFKASQVQHSNHAVTISAGDVNFGVMGEVSETALKRFDVKVPVFFADLDWDAIANARNPFTEYREISKFPSVTRDLALLVDKNVSYSQIEEIALGTEIKELKSVQLFDVFESDKLGAGKKSMAVSFMFQNEHKTLTDKEIDSFMQQIILSYEKLVNAAIRK